MRASLGAMVLALAVLPGARSLALADDDLGVDTFEHAKADDLEIIAVVNFDSSKSALLPKAREILARVSAEIAGNPSQKIEVAGHADSSGAEGFNVALSGNRAHSVADWLVGHGVAAERLTVIGYGPYQPVDTNETPAGRAKNRRVELKVSR